MAAHALELSLGVLVWNCALHAGSALKKCPGKGVQYNFARSSLPAGWMVHYDQPYSHETVLANVRPGAGDCILWAAQKVESPDAMAIAGTADRVAVESSSMVWINDVFWYTVEGKSAGFAGTDNVDLSPGDNGQYSCFARVSWLLGRSEGGYRAGCEYEGMNSMAAWRKVVMFGPEVQECQVSVCSLGMILKIMDLPTYCSGVACSEEECCQNAGRCKITDCNGIYVLKKIEEVPLFCSSAICAQEECCTLAPKCDSSVCGPLYSLRTVMTGLPTQCSTAICNRDECCKINPPCASSDCDVGFVLKPTGAPAACAAKTCTNSECCTDAGRCSPSVCLGQYAYKSDASRPAYCVGVTCTRQECCGGYLPPTVSVAHGQLIDLDLDAFELGGEISWSPPAPERVASYKVYIGNSKWSKDLIGEIPWGTNSVSFPHNTVIRQFLLIYTSNEGGMQATPFTSPVNDTNMLPLQLVFIDYDLDEGEIGGTLNWGHPIGYEGVVKGYSVYMASNIDGNNKSKLGNVSSSENSFSLGPNVPFRLRILLYPFSSLAERSRPAELAIDDNQAYVSNLDFMADAGSLDNEHIRGTITWKAPANTRYVTAYRLYLTSDPDGSHRKKIGSDIPVGTNEVDIPGDTDKENFTHYQVATVSKRYEQSRPSTYKFLFAATAGMIAVGAVGLGAAGRAASAAAGANSAGNAVDGMKMEKMERCAVKTSNLTAKSVTALGSYINKDRQKFEISSCDGQYLRSFWNSALPCCVHHHHHRLTLKGPNSKNVLHRMHLSDNSWDDSEVLLKKISNSYYSVVGLTPEPFLIKRRVPKSRIFSPLGLSGIMAKGLAPIIAIIIIAIVVCGLNDWLTGAILGFAAVLAFFMVIFAKPGGFISQCIESVVNFPPARIRDSFWAFVGLLVGVMPATPAFMAGTVVGHITGALAVLCAFLCFLGRDVFSMFVQFFAGAALTIYTFIEAFTNMGDEKDEDGQSVQVDIIMFVSAALVLVSAIDTYVKNSAAKFQDIDLPEDEIVKTAEKSAKDIGVSVCHALALEAFISGHMEERLQGRLVSALEGLAKEAVSLSKAVLHFLVEEIQEKGVEKARRCFERRVPKLVDAYFPLVGHDAGLVAKASEDTSDWEDFETSFGKLVMDAFTERFIKECKKSISKVRESAGYLQSRVDSMKRLAGLDARASHHMSSVVVSHRAESVKELADDLKRRVPADGDLVEMVKFEEKILLMKEDFDRMGEVLQVMMMGAESDDTYKHQIDFDKLSRVQTSANRGLTSLESLGMLIQPGTTLSTENVKLVTQHLGAVSDAAASIRTMKPKVISRASTLHFDEAVLAEAREELPQLEFVRNEDDRGDIVSAYCTARGSAAIVDVVNEEIRAVVARVEIAVKELDDGRAAGLRILNELRDARKAQTLHLLSVRDEVICWLARYPQKIWTRLKVLHYTADKRFSDVLDQELDRTISRDMRHSIARQFSVLDTEKSGPQQSKWAAKIFGRASRRVHPERSSSNAYAMSGTHGCSVPGRMTATHTGSTSVGQSYKKSMYFLRRSLQPAPE